MFGLRDDKEDKPLLYQSIDTKRRYIFGSIMFRLKTKKVSLNSVNEHSERVRKSIMRDSWEVVLVF